MMLAKQALHTLLSRVHDGCFRVDYWDGSSHCYGRGEPQFTLGLKDPAVLAAVRESPERGFTDGYEAGTIDVDGDLADLVATALRNESAAAGWAARRALGAVRRIGGRRSRRQQTSDVQSHYDLGNEFFRLWLDESMTYSCAYFRTPEDTLEEAQRRKIDHTLRKLRIRPGDRLLDIGSGWGSVVMAAAERFGASVVGITLSEEQLEQSRRAIAERGLADRAEIRLQHYGDLAREGRRFDRIVSVGMIEHVGQAHLPEFCAAAAALLEPGGLALFHHITQPRTSNGYCDPDKAPGQSVFPGTYCPTPHEMLGHLADHGFRLITAENLREHYRLTLDEWSRRYEAHVDQVRAMFDERFVRHWRLYLRGASACFREGSREVHQFLVSSGVSRLHPLTQDDVYAAALADG